MTISAADFCEIFVARFLELISVKLIITITFALYICICMRVSLVKEQIALHTIKCNDTPLRFSAAEPTTSVKKGV